MKHTETFNRNAAAIDAIDGATLGRTADAPGPDRGTVGCVATDSVATLQR